MSNRFVHIELGTDDTKKAKTFYKGLFDWKFKDVPMGPGMTYTTIDTGSKEGGGGLTSKPAPEVPTMWLPYVEVADVKKSVAKARKLGATIQMDYTPIPGMGAFAVFLDPTNAPLGIYEAGKKPAEKKGSAKKAKKKSKK